MTIQRREFSSSTRWVQHAPPALGSPAAARSTARAGEEKPEPDGEEVEKTETKRISKERASVVGVRRLETKNTSSVAAGNAGISAAKKRSAVNFLSRISRSAAATLLETVKSPSGRGGKAAGGEIDQVRAYVSLGYPFGWMASILFGRHHRAVLQSEKPKLFVMGK